MNEYGRTRHKTGNALTSILDWGASRWLFPVLLSAGLVLGPTSAGAQPFAYVTNQSDATVSVINTALNTVVETITVGDLPVGLASTPDGSRVYVAVLNSQGVDVIDTTTRTVTATIRPCTNPLGCNPLNVAFSPDGSKAWVTASASNEAWMIDTAGNIVVDTVPVLGTQPRQVALTPDGAFAYVTMKSGEVHVVDTTARSVVTTVPVGDEPQGVALLPAGNRAYVTSPKGNKLSAIDTTSNTIVATIPMPFPFRIAISPDGNRAYVSNTTTDQVSVVDTTGDTVTATISVGDAPKGIAMTPDGAHVYVVNELSNNVSVIATATNTVVATVPVGISPYHVSIAPPFACSDADEDGFGSPGNPTCPNGSAEDCDDLDASVFPGADELCDGRDNDCDGQQGSDEVDDDLDGFMVCQGDCDDADANRNSDALELPGNSVDENCDGSLGACDPNVTWRNHGQFVRCVAHEVNDLVAAGLLAEDDGDDLVQSAAQSDVGK